MSARKGECGNKDGEFGGTPQWRLIMEIIIRTVDDIYSEEKPPCKKATLRRVIYLTKPISKNYVERNEWVVEVKTIEDILEISRETGFQVIVKAAGLDGYFNDDKGIPVLTIYDGYLE